MVLVGGLDIDAKYLPGIGGSAPAERSPFSAGLASAAGQIRYGVPYALERRWNTLSPEDEASYQAGLRNTAARVNTLLPGGAPSAADWWNGKASLGQLVGENIAFSAPQMAASLGAAIATRGRAALPVAIGANVPFFVGSNVDRATNSGETSLTQQQAGRALLASVPQAASDALVERFLPGAGKIFGDLAATQTGGFLARTAKSIGKAALTEATAETSQQALERYSAALPLVSPEATKEYVQAFTTSAFVGGAFGALGGIRKKDASQVQNQDLTAAVDEGITGIATRPQLPNFAGRPVADGSTISVDQTGNSREVAGSAQPAAAVRPFGQTTDEELISGANALERRAQGGALSPEMQQVQAQIADEINFRAERRAEAERRAAIMPTQQPELPLEPPLSAMAPGTQGELFGGLSYSDVQRRAPEAAPAPEPSFADRVTELKKGLNRNQFVAKLNPENEQDLVNKVYDQIFTEQDTRTGTIQLAQRLGILDENLQPTETASQIEAARAAPVEQAQTQSEQLVDQLEPAQREELSKAFSPALPEEAPDPAFIDRFQKLKTAVRGADVTALEAVNQQDLERKVYRALGEPNASNAMEKLAQTIGILDADKQLTEKGKFYAGQDPIPFEEAGNAALGQGFSGAQAASFTRGVANYMGTPAPENFGSFEELAAFQAGKDWAEEYNSVPRVADAYTSKKVGMKRNPRVTSIELTPEQRTQRSLNNAIDQVATNENLKPSTVTTLKQMVKEGAPAAEIDTALQAVRDGMELFQQPPKGAPRDYKGEVVTRGAPRGKVDPVTRERQTRRSMRAETAQKVYEFKKGQYREKISEAFANGDVNQRDVIALNANLIAGNFDAIDNKLSGQQQEGARADLVDLTGQQAQGRIVDNQQAEISRRQALGGIAAAAAAGVSAKLDAKIPAKTAVTGALKTYLEAGNIPKALEHIKANSTNPIYRLIAAKLGRGDWSGVTVGLANEDPGLYGSTTLNQDGSSNILLYGDRGATEETFLHEAIHAYVQQRWAGIAYYTPENKRQLGDTVERNDKVVQRFQDIWNDISSALKKTNPELIDTKAWAQQAYIRPDEMLSWAMTNPEAQAYLKTIDRDGNKVTAEKSLWRRIVDYVRDLLGLPSSKATTTALDEIMSAGFSVLDAGVDVKTGDFGSSFATAVSNQQINDNQINPAQTLSGAAKNVKAAIDRADSAKAALERLPGAKTTIRNALLGWSSITHMASHYSKQFPQLKAYVDAQDQRRATAARFAQLIERPYQAWERLMSADQNSAKLVGKLMAYTEFGIDPQKDWTNHQHLHQEANAQHLQRLVSEANKEFNELKRKGHAQVYNDFRDVNEAMHNATMSVSLYNLVTSDPTLKNELPGFDTDPVEAFRELSAFHESPESARKYWEGVLDKQVADVTDYIKRFRGGTMQLTSAEAGSLSNKLSPVEMRIRSIKQSQAAMQQSPYFHLGRFGDHFVAFKMPVDPKTKQVDRSVVDQVARALEGTGAQISQDTDKSNVFIRVDNEGQRRALREKVLELANKGYVDKESVRAGVRGDGASYHGASPAWLEAYIQALQADIDLRADGVPDAQMDAAKAEMISKARSLWLDMLPDTALNKVLVQRNAVPGFNPDMIRNFAFRHQVGVNALANMAASNQVNAAFTQMRAAVKEAQTAESDQNVDLLAGLYGEVVKREVGRSTTEGNTWIDNWRALNHAFFLGMSPSYVAVNMTQLGVLLWPELAKKHGFVDAAKTIAKVTPMAFKIMKATFDEGRAGGWKRAADAVITEDVLTKAGVPPKKAEFVMKMLASGTIDIGGSMRELARVAEGGVDSKFDTAIRYASAAGLYSETLTRLVAALSAQELRGDYSKETQQYAQDTVTQSMLNYSNWNTARQTGKLGLAGQFSPVMFSFMTYQFQVIEKMYRELHAAFLDKASTPEEKREAKRFLAGHLGAIVALTGTLGMPAASLFAFAAEKLVDLFDDDDEPYDITAAWRNWLSGTFGAGVGEVVARGLPRALGVDVSSRAGEQDIIPLTGLLTDRRKWEDASSDWAVKAAGAPVSMVMNITKGMGQVADGDLMTGMTTMMPTAIKGPLQAFRMTSDGYVDSKGNKLPMTPGASAILAQALGFTPAEKAEYSEAKGDQTARRTSLTQRATVLRNNIVRAIAEGDTAKAKTWIADARRFDKANPAFSVLNDIEPALKRRARIQALAAASQSPIGTSAKDLAASEISRYANVDYAAQ